MGRRSTVRRAWSSGAAALVAAVAVTAAGRVGATSAAYPIAYASQRSLAVINTDGTGARQLGAAGDIAAWSPDGAVLVVGAGGLWVHDATTGGSQQLTTGLDGSPSFSPDGRSVAYARASASGSPSLRIVGRDGTNDHELATANCPAAFPQWSPGGDLIAFALEGTGACYGVGVVAPDGSGYRVLDEANNPDPSWSPDGRTIAIARIPGIDLVSPDGSGKRTILPSTQAWTPVWSPDSAQLAFPVFDGSHTDLYRANVDGSGLQALTNSPTTDEGWVTWAPDGATIVYEATGSNGTGLEVLDVASGHASTLTNGPADHWPTFGPKPAPPPSATTTTTTVTMAAATATSVPSETSTPVTGSSTAPPTAGGTATSTAPSRAPSNSPVRSARVTPGPTTPPVAVPAARDGLLGSNGAGVAGSRGLLAEDRRSIVPRSPHVPRTGGVTASVRSVVASFLLVLALSAGAVAVTKRRRRGRDSGQPSQAS